VDAKIEKDGKLSVNTDKRLNTGIVIALGESVDHPDIVVGRRVHWGKNAGADIQPDYLHEGKLNGEEYFICMEEDILGVFENGEKENVNG
jgi:co-chaperonin GroES (HSP10)